MDESVTPPEQSQDEEEIGDENAKRFKSSESSFESLEELNIRGDTEDVASTSVSSSSGAARWSISDNSRRRNYRKSRENDIDVEEMATPTREDVTTSDTVEDTPIDTSNDSNDFDEEEYEEDAFGDYSFSSGDSTPDSSAAKCADIKDHPIFKKEKPKHNWFALNQINQRQLGASSKYQISELFQRRCYGSLHCVQRLELMYKLQEHQGCVNSLNFHHDGSLLASGSDDLKVVVWDWKIGKMLTKYKTRHKGNVFNSKFLHLSGDLHIATCARDGQVRLAQLNSEQGVRNSRLLGVHKGPCHKLIVLPEQPHIVISAGEDGVVFNHDVRGPKSIKLTTVKEDGRSITLYSIHGHPIKTHEYCVSGADNLVRVYDQRYNNKLLAGYSPFKKTRERISRHHYVTCAVYNHNGTEILASYSDADVYLFDVNDTEDGKFLHQYQGHRNGATIKGVNFFGPKSEFVVSGSDCGHVFYWDRNTEALVQWLRADDSGVVNCLEPHPQLPFMCTSGLDWDVKVWVPSCEVDPTMEGLQNILKENMRRKNPFESSDINESQMWMLWRHLRNNSRMRMMAPTLFLSYSDSNSDSDSSSSNSNSSEEFEGASNCQTS